jgi:hypothetical protein
VGQTVLSLYPETRVRQVRLNGVPLPPPAGPSPEARLPLTAPGRYEFEVICSQ